MYIRFSHRFLSMLTALFMLLGMLPVPAAAQEHAPQAADLFLCVSASAAHVYVGEGAVTITADITGGTAPYAVTIQAVRNGDAVFTQTMTISGSNAVTHFVPDGYGDYELVAVVCDAQNTQVLDTASLTVAEHDAEGEAEWAASVAGAAVSGDWAASLLSVARTQIGYRESERDFIIKSGVKQGYSRYGAWFGTPYADWNNAFLAFAAEYASIPADAFLSGASSRSWANAMRAKGAYAQADGGYTPQPGDVAFLSGSRVAVIESVSGGKVAVIEGDVDGAVARKTYALSKLAGIGNTRLLMGLYKGTATAVPAAPTQTPAGSETFVTAAPTARPTATPEPEEEEVLTFQATSAPGPGVTAAPKEETNPLERLIDTAGDAVMQLEAASTSVPAQFTEAFYLMQAEVRQVAERYLGEGEKPDAEIKAFAEKLTMQEVYYLRMEMAELEAHAGSIGLTAWEGNAVWEREDTFRWLCEAVEGRWRSFVQSRGTEELLGGNASFAYDAGEAVLSGDNSLTWTVTLSGYAFSAHTKTYTLTFTNCYDCAAELSFDWNADGLKKFDGQSVSEIGTSGSKLKPLAAGESFSFTVTATAAASSKQIGSLTLTNITLTPALANAECTLLFDAEKGNVTVGGEAAASGGIYEVDQAAGLALTAAANEGCSFLGWVNRADGAVLSSEAAFTLQCSENMTVEAVFAKDGGTVWFGVSDRGTSGSIATGYTRHVNAPVYLFDNLPEAADCAASTGYAYIVPMNSGALPAGSYAIPAGVTMLIPFDDARTLYLDSPASTGDDTSPYAYRTLTLAAGAELTVSGTVSLSAMHQYASGNGHSARTIGGYGHMAMESGSKITVDSGGKLYAWGYITGGGEITAESGAAVYEIFQIMDFRGEVSQSMKNGVYPFSQYYMQNIEVPLTLYAGAADYGLTSTYISGSASTSMFPFAASSGAMFNQTGGYLVKDYQEGSDRLTIDAYGSMTVAGLGLELGGVSIDPADFALPVTSSMTVTAHSGQLTISQDLALLPGSEITVGSAAECVIAQSANVYAYDLDEWGHYVYVSGTDAKLRPALYAPGRAHTRTAANLTDAQLLIRGKLTAKGSLYTTEGGAAITGENGAVVSLAPGQELLTYQLQQSQGTNAYQSIPITSARLKNADGSFALTENASGEATYTCVDGRWTCGTWTLADGGWNCAEQSPHADLVTTPEVPPTCEEAGRTAGERCTVCGYVGQEQTEIPVTGHSLPEEWTITPASCTQAGEKSRKCANSGCTYEETETIEATGHAWSGWMVTSTATCTVAGEQARSCNCGEIETETISALGHDWSEVTCDVPKTCRRGCGATEGEMRGHDWSAWNNAEGAAATCIKGGRESRTCQYADCGKVEHRDTAALGHTYRDEQDALIASKGAYSQYACGQEIILLYTCERCAEGDEGHTYEHRTGEILEHDMAYEDEIPATCEAAGGAASGWCRRGCGHTTGGTVIPALGHDWAEASCTTPKTCQRSGCGKTEGGPVHASAFVPEEPAGCTTTGRASGYVCELCGITLSGLEEIPAAGHAETPMAEAELTCTQDGSTGGKACSVCGEVTEEPTITKAKGHQPVTDAAVAPTCTETGLTEGEHCSACGHVITAQTVLPARNHDWSAATCDAPQTCKRDGCGMTQGDALGHSWQEANCTAPRQCKTCKATEGTALSHDWVAATCITKKTCNTCGLTEGWELGHTMVTDEGKPATCTEPGLTEGAHCGRCGETLVTQHEITATAHENKVTGTQIDATCTVNGWTAGVYCPDCDTWLEVQEEIPPLGHKLGEGVVAIPPTCDEIGAMAYICQRGCGYVASEDIPEAHTPVVIEAVSPTEDKDGATEGSKCSECGKILVQPEAIPAKGWPPKNGWVSEDGGWRYYTEDVYSTGVVLVDGLYYDFGESGVNADKTPYTGLYVMNGDTYYIRSGKPATGWQQIGADWYCFDSATGIGLNGEHLVSGRVYPFENGRLLHGVWVKDDVGLMYFYGPGSYAAGWQVIEGEEYFFRRGYVVTGITPVQASQDEPVCWYEFTDAGVKLGIVPDGLYWHEGELYYVVDGSADRVGMYYIDGHYYYFTYNDYAVRGQTCQVTQTNGLPVKTGQYRFDAEGRANMTTEIVAENGKLVYYENGPLGKNAGLVMIDDAYYFIDGEGKAVTNKTLLVEKNNGLVPAGSYTFGADGRMQIRLAGDANDDYAVTPADAVLVFAYAAGDMVSINLANADVNADGQIDAADALLIMQHAAGWDVTLR